MNRKLFLIISILSLSLFSFTAQGKTIRIKRLGTFQAQNIGKQKYKLSHSRLGSFEAYKLKIARNSFNAEVPVHSIRMKGARLLKFTGLQTVGISASPDGLNLKAVFKPKGKLKKLFKFLRIKKPSLKLEGNISTEGVELKATLNAERKINISKKLGTYIRLKNIELSLSMGRVKGDKKAKGQKYASGKRKDKNQLQPVIFIKSRAKIRPSKYDPEIYVSPQFTYNLLTQTFTLAGTMGRWNNPFPFRLMKIRGVSFQKAAFSITLTPYNPALVSGLGFAIEDAKFGKTKISAVISVNPANGKFGVYFKQNRMPFHNIKNLLPKPLKKLVSKVFPSKYELSNILVKFAPTNITVGEIKVSQGLQVNGNLKIANAMEGNLNFKMSKEDGFYLDLGIEADFKKAIMNELKKRRILAPIMGKVLSTFEVRRLKFHAVVSKKKPFKGSTNCHFKIFGRDIKLNFKGSLNIQDIKNKLISRIIKKAGPKIAAVGRAMKKALNRSKRIASRAWGNARKAIGTARRHLHSKKKCDRVCVPNLARRMAVPVYNGGKQALQEFYNNAIENLVHMEGNSARETRRMRANFIQSDWNQLNRTINQGWNNIIRDRTYVFYYIRRKSATNGGHIYRRIVNQKRNEFRRFERKLWRSMMNARRPQTGRYNRIQNRWKRTYLHIEQGPVKVEKIGSGAWSSHWILEPVAGGYVKIKNRWKGTYLHIERGRVESSGIRHGWHSAMWKLERVPGTNYVKIRNRWKGTYLHIERGRIECSKIQPGWHSAMWSLKKN